MLLAEYRSRRVRVCACKEVLAMHRQYTDHRTRSLVLWAVLVLIAFRAAPAPAQLSGTYPAFRADARRTGRGSYTGTNEAFVSWRVQTQGDVISSPAVGPSGMIYVGSFDSYLYAVTPQGAVSWAYDTAGWVSSSPAIGANGTIYVGSADNYLHAINPDGTRRWRISTGSVDGSPSPVYSSPIITDDGRVIFASEGGRVFSVDQDTGQIQWTYLMAAHTVSSPAVGPGGKIYIGCGNGQLVALNPNGTLAWTFNTGGQIYSTPAIGDDGTVYVTSQDGRLYAINPDGTSRWSFFAPPNISSSPAIGYDGTIYFGSQSGLFYAVNPNGTQKWVYDTYSPIGSSPLVDPGNSVFFGTQSGRMYALKSDGTLKWQIDLGDRIDSSPAVGSAGTIYVGSFDNGLYAIGPTPSGVITEPATAAQLAFLIGSGGLAAVRRRRLRLKD